MKKIIVAAVSKNNVIGKDGSIPWHSISELTHFKKITLNSPVLMGRKTFNSLKNPLPKRVNIVLSRDSNFFIKKDDVILKRSINEVYDFCIKKEFTKLFIIGGGEVFVGMINIVDELFISRMKLTVQGDTYFPNIDMSIWKLYDKEENEEFVFEKFKKHKKLISDKII